jgi:hypothetical protein
MPHADGTPTRPTHSNDPESTHAEPPRETVREREIIVTNSGAPARDRSSGFGLIFGLVAIVVLIVLGVFAVRALSDSFDDADSLEIPTEVDINIDGGGDDPSN